MWRLGGKKGKEKKITINLQFRDVDFILGDFVEILMKINYQMNFNEDETYFNYSRLEKLF